MMLGRVFARHLVAGLAMVVMSTGLAIAQSEQPVDALVRLDTKFRGIQVSETRALTRTVGKGYQAMTQAVTRIKRRAGRGRYRTEATTQTTQANGTTTETRTLVVADGTHLWIETQGANGQVSVIKAPQPADTGSDLFQLIEIAFESEASYLPAEKWGEADCTVVLLRTPASAYVKIVADKTVGVLYRVQVKQPDGTVTDSAVESYDSSQSFSEALFQYEPPPGASVRETETAPPMANLRARGVPLPVVAAAKPTEAPKVAAGQ